MHAAHRTLVISPSSKHTASLRRLERNSSLEVLGSDTQYLLISRRKELADFIPSEWNQQFLAFPQCAKPLFPADGKRSWVAREQLLPELVNAAESEEKGLKS